MEGVWQAESPPNEIENPGNSSPCLPVFTAKYHESEPCSPQLTQTQHTPSFFDNGHDYNPNHDQINYTTLVPNEAENISHSHACSENEFLTRNSSNFYSATDQYGGQQAVGTLCSSSDCATERERLQTRISELLAEYHVLAATNNEKVCSLRETKLALGIAQDFSKRLQADFTTEVSDMRNKIWRLESESNSLKTERDAYKYMLIRLNKDLQQINGKINELHETDDSREQSDGFPDLNEQLTNENNANNSRTNGYQFITNTISQINFKLNDVLQNKQIPNSASFQNPATPASERYPLLSQFLSDNILKNDLVHQGARQKLPTKHPHPQGSPSPMCIEESINQKRWSQTFGLECRGLPGYQICNNRVEEYQTMSAGQENGGDDDDDDVTIIAEIKNDIPAGLSLGVVNDGESINNQSIEYANAILPGLACVNESQWTESESHENIAPHQSSAENQSTLFCAICNTVFDHPQEFNRHMEGIHKIIVLDSCKLCGKMFKSRERLVDHERTMHSAQQQDSFDMAAKPFETVVNVGVHESSTVSAENLGFVTNNPDGTTTTQSECVSLVFNPVDESVTFLPYAGGESAKTMTNGERIDAISTTGTRATKSTDIFLRESPFSDDRPSSSTSTSSLHFTEQNGSYQQSTRTQVQHGFDSSKSSPGNFVWCVCGSKYATRASLNTHIRGQTRQTNFICGSCKKIFSSFNGAKSHMKVCRSLGIRQ